jgi:hypothetical protein
MAFLLAKPTPRNVNHGKSGTFPGCGAASNMVIVKIEISADRGAGVGHAVVGTQVDPSRRPHSSLDGDKPDQAHFNPLPFRAATGSYVDFGRYSA